MPQSGTMRVSLARKCDGQGRKPPRCGLEPFKAVLGRFGAVGPVLGGVPPFVVTDAEAHQHEGPCPKLGCEKATTGGTNP